MALKTVFFDLGNVLVFFSFPKMLDQIGNLSGMTSQRVKELLFDTNLRERYEKGQIGTNEVFKVFQSHAKGPCSLDEFKEAFCNIFTPNLELWSVVEELKAKGLRLILLSNTSEGHFEYCEKHFSILKLFNHKILSYKVGAWKPDEKIFKKALEVAQCLPEECLYIDDVPEFIESAAKLGLPGIVYQDTVNLKTVFNKRLYSVLPFAKIL